MKFIIVKLDTYKRNKYSYQIQKVDESGLRLYKDLHKVGTWIFDSYEEAEMHRREMYQESLKNGHDVNLI